MENVRSLQFDFKSEDIWRNLNVNIRYVAIPIMSNVMDTQLTK